MADVPNFEASLLTFSQNEFHCSFNHFRFEIKYKGEKYLEVKRLISTIKDLPLLLSDFIRSPSRTIPRISSMQDRIVRHMIKLAPCPPNVMNEDFFIDLNQFLSEIKRMHSRFQDIPEGNPIVLTMQNIGEHSFIIDKISIFFHKLDVLYYILKLVECYHNCFHLRPQPSEALFEIYTLRLTEELFKWPSPDREGPLLAAFLDGYNSNVLPLPTDSVLDGLYFDLL